MGKRTRIAVCGATLVIAIPFILPGGVVYFHSRNEVIEVVSLVSLGKPDAYLFVTQSVATLSSYGAYEVIYSNDDLQQRGYVSTLSDTLIMSMKDISVTLESGHAAASLVKDGDCYVLHATGIAEPRRYSNSLYAYIFGSDIPIKEGDRWQQTLSGKELCFGLEMLRTDPS